MRFGAFLSNSNDNQINDDEAAWQLRWLASSQPLILPVSDAHGSDS